VAILDPETKNQEPDPWAKRLAARGAGIWAWGRDLVHYLRLPQADREKVRCALQAGADHTREIELTNQELENQIAQNQIQADLNVLLTLSLEKNSLAEMLANILNYLTSLPWLALTGGWAVYLRDSSQERQVLRCANRLPEKWPDTFPSLNYPACLCGNRSELLASGICTRSFEGAAGAPAPAYPHYGVWLLDDQTLPVGNLILFATPGSAPDQPVQSFLAAAANILTGVIQRKQTEEALRLEHDKSEQYLANAGLIFIILGTDGKVQLLNRKGCELLGIGAAEALGRNWFKKFLPERAQDEALNFFMSLVLMGQNQMDYFSESPVLTSAGQERLITWHWTLIKNTDGSLQILASGEDITEQTRLHTQLLQAQKLEAIGQLASGIAHEINTPTQYVGDNLRFLQESFLGLAPAILAFPAFLQAVKNHHLPAAQLEEMERSLNAADFGYLSEEIPKAVDQALEGVQRVAAIVRAMKEFAHPDVADIMPTDLNRGIESTVTIARNEWKYVADVETELDPALPEVPCLGGQFNQVILNLLVNAAHAIGDALGPEPRKKGAIRIKTSVQGAWAVVQVSDTGTGIPPAVLPKIFNPFFTTKKAGRGSGQGLAISHNVIVEKLKGRIDVATEVGKGTTFTLYLPLLTPVLEEAVPLA
jgi:PAS domain S-box-containing protein